MISGSWVWSTGHEEELPTVMPPRDDDDDDDDDDDEDARVRTPSTADSV